MTDDLPMKDKERQFALYLRYQTTNDRAFHRSLNDLLKLRAERRRAENGFELQKQKQAQEGRREAAEKRRLDEAALSQRAEDVEKQRHKWDVLLAEAKVDHQIVLTSNLTLDQVIAEAREEVRQEAQRAA